MYDNFILVSLSLEKFHVNLYNKLIINESRMKITGVTAVPSETFQSPNEFFFLLHTLIELDALLTREERAN